MANYRNIFNRYIVPIRPLLILALIASIYLFTFDAKKEIGPSDNNTAAAVESAASNTSSENNSDYKTDPSINAIPTQSLIASLFGPGSIDPFFTLPELAPPSNADSQQENISSIPTEEPARSIYRYLIDASSVGFEANPSRLGLALATSEQGEIAALNAIISDFEKRLVAYASIIPPKELSGIHSASISLLERYIAHMRNSRDRADGTVVATWNNSERDAIAEEATRITQQIREIVDNYDISLPSGVLP